MHSENASSSDFASRARQPSDGGKAVTPDVGRVGLKPIRVLHIIDSLVAGGKERQLLELFKGLQAGSDIVCELAIMSNEVQYDEFDRKNYVTHFLPRQSRYDFSIFPRLRRIVREFQPDILHSWNAMCSIYGAPVAKLAGLKFVNGYVRAAHSALTMRNRDYFRGKLTMPLSDVVVSNSVAGLGAYGVPSGMGICIYNGFDQRRLEGLVPPHEVRDALGVTTKHVVGMVASFSDLKDYDTFFRVALEIVSARNDVTFLAVGDGENFKHFQGMLSPETRPKIKLLGHRRDVENIVNTFTVGVLTSNTKLHGEGISNAIMEYMALGKPVVATNCGGNGEIISVGETGYLIPGGDAAALSGHVLNLLDNPALAFRLGEDGRRRIRETFSLQRMTQSYVNLYRGLLD